VTTLPAAELPAWLAADPHRLRGEFALVVHAFAAAPAQAEASALDHVLRSLLATLPLKQAVELAAKVTGAPRNALYTRALAMKDRDA
jgi:16S rRNA (cytidine1402-2'-O)-methyltransferase